MPANEPETVICRFQVRADAEQPFRALLRVHWPTLRRLGLVTEDPPQHYRAVDEQGRPVYVEIFTWRDGRAAQEAHEHPEVAAVWEPMAPLVEEREGRRKWEFPHYRRLDLSA